MDNYISMIQRIVALVMSGMALWKAISAVSAPQDGTSAKLGFIKGWKPGGDLGLYAASLLVAAIAALSLSSALLTQKELMAWSGAPYVLIIIAILSALACIFPIGTRRDLRHLFWIGLAGLIPAVVVVVRGAKTGNSTESGEAWILLFVWVFLASSLAVYSISKSGHTLAQQRNLIRLGAVLIVICALALGIYWTDTLKNDPRGHGRAKEVSALKVKVSQLSRPDQLMFYQLASEAALSAHYRGIAAKKQEGPPIRSSDSQLNLSEFSDNLEARLDSLPEREQYELFRKRLNGVHPVPKIGEQRVPTNVPGIEAEQRFDYFNTELIVAVLAQYEEVKTAFFQAAGAGYSEDIRTRLKTDTGLSLNLPSFGALLRSGQKGQSGKSQVQGDSEPYTVFEAELFGLPPQQSAKIVLDYYKKLAIESAKAANSKDVSGLVQQFEKMADSEKAAFLNYATDDAVIGLLGMLSNHTTEDPVVKLRTRANQQTADQLEEFRKSGFISGDEETRSFIKGLSTLLETDDHKSGLVKLLGAGTLDPLISVSLVFQEEPLALAGNLSKNVNATERSLATAIMADPVAQGLKGFLNSSLSADQIGPVLSDFLAKPQEQREALLHNTSLDIYGLGGPHALGFFSQTIDQVGQSRIYLGIGIATLFCIPAVLIVSLLGAAFGKQLLSLSFSAEKLERQPKCVLEEQAQTLPQWGFVGRRTLLDRLRRLSVRSSGTVGLVGRRGIGKTRILRQLLQEYDAIGAVTVWLDCPTSMSQEDFVQSISERVVDIVESRFANFAGFPNNARRQLDRAVISGSAMAVLFLSLLYAAVILSLLPDLTPGLVAPTLVVPSLTSAAAGFGILLIRFSGSVASGRLSTGGVALGTATFEWQQAYDALALMADRLQARRASAGSKFRWSDSPVSLALVAVPAGIVLTVLIIILVVESPKVFIALALTGIFYIGWRMIMRRGRVSEAAFSAVSFTYRFRAFVLEIADRIRAGALGKSLAESEIVMVVVVDELDKIVDRNELKAFIRVIKTVFDIRGTRFFLSISQDAYRDLVLGSALGKNEFDSSFDHIELIDPMDLDSARTLVQGYLKSLSQVEMDDPTIDVIAALGKGVPRDVLRRCDTAILLWAEQPASLGDRLLIAERDNLLAGLRYLAGLSDRVVRAFTELDPPLDTLLELIASNETNEPLVRILSENFVYVHILSTHDPVGRHELIGRYYSFLYSLPTLTTESIRSALAIMLQPTCQMGTVPPSMTYFVRQEQLEAVVRRTKTR